MASGRARACAISASSAATAASSTCSTFASSTAASNSAPAATTAPPPPRGGGQGGGGEEVCIKSDAAVIERYMLLSIARNTSALRVKKSSWSFVATEVAAGSLDS